ncbi:MAG: hypothetical protein COX19_09385 [Desulfobacterales bacterium CG23_combo_of_CG06-09_8_20_14_all_51_8]|nr:MAG: hypothetical protein COX19_09385 [Desulfobacterales bacterium CG23_combo_of_CG06-09_8_20_14_all_51_8]
MVEKGAMNPLNPDLSLVPMDILSEFYWDALPDGDILPSQTAVNVSNFLFIACLFVLERQKGHGMPKEVTARASEAIMAMDRLLILAGLETLRREGLLNYHTNGGWHNGEGEILISNLRPDTVGLGISPLFKTFFNFN